MKKSLISSHFAHHRPRDKLVTYYLNCEGGQIKMPKEALDDYMARYCANSRRIAPAAFFMAFV